MYRTLTNKEKFTYVKAIHKNNCSLTKSLRLKSASVTPCPIKPTENIIPKDLNLQKIFTIMLKSSQELSKTYSPSIMKNTYANIFLNININNISRKTILRKIRDFFLFHNIDYKIYFKAILLYDIITIENEKKKLFLSLEDIAIGSLILSIKFNFDENKMFSMKKYWQFYGEQNYTLNDIIDIERKAIKTINYFLNLTTPMCFLEFFLLNGIIYNTDYLDKNNYPKIYFETENTLENIMEESNNYLKYNFFYLACSVVSYCRDMFNLEKWPKAFKKVFSVDFYFFQNEYDFFFNKKENNNKGSYSISNKAYSHKTYNYNDSKDIIINGNNNVVLLDLKNINDNNNNIIKNKRNNNYYNSYKRNYYKTIDHYNNIINININNVSFNNIYNNSSTILENANNNNNTNNSNNSKDKKNIKSFKSKRFHYKINNNSISYNNDIQNNNDIYNNSCQNNITTDNCSNNDKNIGVNSNNNYIFSENLTEIKEVKDFPEQITFSSPPKRKRKHYYIYKKENINNIKIGENNEKGKNEEKKDEIDKNEKNNEIKKNIVNKNINKIKEENKNQENTRNIIKDNYNYIKKIKTYNFDNSAKKTANNSINQRNYNNNIKLTNRKYNKKEFNNILNLKNQNEYNIKDNKDNILNANIDSFNKNEENNNNKNFENKSISLKEINNINNNNKNKKDKENIIEENKEENSPAKKANNLLISKYFNYTYFKTEKLNSDKKSIKNKIINNIKPTKLENIYKNKTQNYIEKEKNNNNTLSLGKYENSKIRKSYRYYKNNKNNLNKILERNESSIKKDKKNILIINKEKDKEISTHKKKHKGENKIKYNDLIKLKLSKCDSINKRKKY